jgi:hypothetical protein
VDREPKQVESDNTETPLRPLVNTADRTDTFRPTETEPVTETLSPNDALLAMDDADETITFDPVERLHPINAPLATEI